MVETSNQQIPRRLFVTGLNIIRYNLFCFNGKKKWFGTSKGRVKNDRIFFLG